MILTPAVERLILHWGEMGARWGVNRSVAQIHALLYLSPDPLNAEDISTLLHIARSNVSTSLKELQSWRLISLTHKIGDRRDHFVAEQDLWTMLLTIVEQRRVREIEPTLTVLRQISLDAEEEKGLDPDVQARIIQMMRFMETLTEWYHQMNRLPKSTLIALMKMGNRVAKLVPVNENKRKKSSG